ncbi:MAG TPA: glycosyltransferase [Candidatus Sulfopaludibacter sp.]|nr:glycosyltransferase [Candidatus Sulfopaludibacter sp.]
MEFLNKLKSCLNEHIIETNDILNSYIKLNNYNTFFYYFKSKTGEFFKKKIHYSPKPINCKMKNQDIDFDVPSDTFENKIVPVTLIIPAYNEEFSIGYALTSLLNQTVLPEQILVVDDSSSDKTGEIAKSFKEVTVVKTPKNSGSKGHALNYGLSFVKSKFTMAMDADITLEKNAIKKMLEYMDTHSEISATCTFVLPKKIKTLWDHTRFIEYLFALSFYKSVQQMYDSIVICSGCFTIYKTNDLKEVGGWPTHTIAEDMELTWVLYEHGKHIGYNADTFCFAVEPENFRLLFKQLKRWNIGFFQVLKLKWKNMKKLAVIREFVIAGLLDTLIGIAFNIALIYYTISHLDLSRYGLFIILDIIMLLIPSLWLAIKIKMARQLLRSLPIYLIFRILGSFFFFYGLLSVFIIRKNTIHFEKGHK